MKKVQGGVVASLVIVTLLLTACGHPSLSPPPVTNQNASSAALNSNITSKGVNHNVTSSQQTSAQSTANQLVTTINQLN